MGRNIIILSIETSCDETSAAVVENGRQVLSNVISSQVELHKKFGGVVPEVASRKHVESVIPVIHQSLEEASVRIGDINAISVTYGPGLVGALLVGISAAKALAYTLDIPLIGVNHIEGHIAANYLQDTSLKPPFICLVVSGGHSHIIGIKSYHDFTVLGQTRDDAAGEAFDKVARALGLGYPGGPLIDKASKYGDFSSIKFPRVYFGDGSLDFSFSGLKTAVLNHINKKKMANEDVNLENIAASFQKAVVDVLVDNTVKAACAFNVNKIAMAGGVASNSLLRNEMHKRACKEGLEVVCPKPSLCTDNAAMIGCAGYYRFLAGDFEQLDLNAAPSLKI